MLKFKIWNFQTISNVDMVYFKVVVLDAVYNFVVDKFSILLNPLESKIFVFKLS